MNYWELCSLLPHYSCNLETVELRDFPLFMDVLAKAHKSKMFNKKILLGVVALITFSKYIEKVLAYDNNKLYFRNPDDSEGSSWLTDSPRFIGFTEWLRYRQGLYEISYREVKVVVDIGIEYGLIPYLPEDGFNLC